jgi:hypothetical protein
MDGLWQSTVDTKMSGNKFVVVTKYYQNDQMKENEMGK